jgi:class 3 adenylate cyclase
LKARASQLAQRLIGQARRLWVNEDLGFDLANTVYPCAARLWEGLLSGERVERRLAAILAVDVAGYSRLMGADEEGTHAVRVVAS